MSDQKTTTIRVGPLAVEWPCDDLFEQMALVRAENERLTAERDGLAKAAQGFIREADVPRPSPLWTDGEERELVRLRAALATEEKG